MPKSRVFWVFSALFACSLLVQAWFGWLTILSEVEGREPSLRDELFSPAVGQRFYEIAYELANAIPLAMAKSTAESVVRPAHHPERSRRAEQENEQALIFLKATTELDKKAKYHLPEMLKLTTRYSQQDNSQIVLQLFSNYLDSNADLEITSQAIQYVLERLNTRQEREKLLTTILQSRSDESPVLDSELATLMALLKAETADTETAKLYLAIAYNKNKYNKLAFAKAAELMPQQLTTPIHLEHLRLMLRENPLNMDAALAFARYALHLQFYEIAADAYKYCADLFRYLYPLGDLPADIYLPWAVSYYSTERVRNKSLQIADDIRKSGRFDLALEAIAGKAAMKMGDAQQANRILRVAEEKARQLFYAASQEPNTDYQIKAEQLAWFYCFALQDSDNALEWANKAYSTEPNSPAAAAILAYALVLNNQLDWAKPIIDNYELTPIANLALAQIKLANGEKESAFKTLKSVITDNSGSLVAEKANEILTSNGGEYIPPVDPIVAITALRDNFNQKVVPEFTSPGKIISVGLNVKGGTFSYGNDFGGSVAITNGSSEPLIVSDDGLFTGNIRVDANVSGDINKKIPNLVSMRVRPSSPIEPGRSIVIPLRLVTAELRDILLTYPQASLNIEFTAYIDPVITRAEKVGNKLADVKPATVTITRPGIEINAKFLQNRVNAFSKKEQSQEKTAQLFIGLLLEQQAIAGSEPLYKFRYADWMPAMLKSALVQGLTNTDWVTKVHMMTSMLLLPLDYELINAVSENLTDEYWPTRMMALYLLAQTKDANFSKVLDWMARYDSNKLVREMAVALGGTKPQTEPPKGQPAQGQPNKPQTEPPKGDNAAKPAKTS